MNTVLSKYKHFDISLHELKSVLGEDLYNISDVTPEKVVRADVVFAIKQYLTKEVTLSAWLIG